LTRLKKSLRPKEVYIPDFPLGIGLVEFESIRHAKLARLLLNAVYRDGGGEILEFETWWKALIADDEYDPALCFVAEDSDGVLVGFAHCWATGFVKDIAVTPECRRRGLGKALMVSIFEAFQSRGLPAVELKIDPKNPHGVDAFYLSLGMELAS